MKKIFKSLMFLVMGAFALASCEDVPAPYVVPSGDTGSLPYTSTSLNTDWTTEALNELGNPWIQGSSYTQATGYQKWDGAATKSNKECEGLLTSPALNTASNSADGVVVAFQYILAYETQDPQYADHIKLYVYQDNVNGTAPEMSTWTQLPLQLIPRTGSGWDVFNTESIQLPEDFVNKENVRLAFWFYAPADKSVTYELKNFTVQDGKAGGDVDPTPEEGTRVTCAEAVELTNALDDGATSTETYTVTGYITEVVGNVSKNQQTFWMADSKDGGRVFEAYWANLPEGVSAFAQGAKVKITGKLTKYVNSSGVVTPEIKNATVEIIEAADEGGGETEEGTLVTCAEAVEQTNALADGATSTEVYTVTGYITEVVGNVSKNQQTFWMADSKDGGRVFEAYWANLPEGVSAFAQGAKVKITGKLTKYVNSSGVVTPEIKNATVEIIEAADEGGTDDPGTSTTSEYMSIASLPSTITTNSYGTQKVSDETTWISWTWNEVNFKGVRICKATDSNGGGIQVQGKANEVASQGFIFNSSAWTANIQKITIVLKVKINADPTKMYDPSYTLYAGSEAHPTTTAITPASQSEEVDGFRVYTQVFDLANASAKYFTIANDQAGALYIDKIYVE